MMTSTRRLFELGQVVATPGALDASRAEWERIPAWAREGAIQGAEAVLFTFLARHARGDWGEVGPEDARENDFSIKNGYRILSAYTLPLTGVKVWIITEADRSSTTFLLPEEY